MNNVLLLGVLNLEHHMTVEAQDVIQDINHNAPLTSAEIARLWQTNLYYSTIMCIVKHLLNTLGDPDLRPPLEFGLSICEDRVNLTGKILRMEGQPVPKGFGDEDTDFGAPRLFTDLYYYYHTLNMIRVGLPLGGMNLAHSVREDVRNFYTEALMATTKFFNLVIKIMLEKGIYIRPPIINTFKEEDVVEKQNFLRGFLGQRRPLLAQEIEYLFLGIETNMVGGALAAGFQQVARSEQVRGYMARGAEIARKHVNIFSSALQKENIPVPMHSGELVTDSTIPPFSDRLMMQHVVILAGIGTGNYATAMTSSLRHDLSVNYARLMGEAANYGEDGINIMIENGWFEEPPRVIDRRELAEEPVH